MHEASYVEDAEIYTEVLEVYSWTKNIKKSLYSIILAGFTKCTGMPSASKIQTMNKFLSVRLLWRSFLKKKKTWASSTLGHHTCN